MFLITIPGKGVENSFALIAQSPNRQSSQTILFGQIYFILCCPLVRIKNLVISASIFVRINNISFLSVSSKIGCKSGLSFKSFSALWLLITKLVPAMVAERGRLLIVLPFIAISRNSQNNLFCRQF